MAIKKHIKSIPARLANKLSPLELETAKEVSSVDKYDLGLNEVDNTSDEDKPISIAQQAALDLKTDKSTEITINGVTQDLSTDRTWNITSNSYVEKTANYTLTSSDYTVNCTANSFTITLPTAVGVTGRCFEITNTGSGIITLDGNGSETIQGDLTQSIYQDECFVVRSTGLNWIVV